MLVQQQRRHRPLVVDLVAAHAFDRLERGAGGELVRSHPARCLERALRPFGRSKKKKVSNRSDNRRVICLLNAESFLH